jgi:hypothetical protein
VSDVTQSFRRQAEDYFQAATVGRELAVRPVLLYYAFLNLAKAYAMVKGNHALTKRAYHGISSFSPSSGTKIPGLPVKFDTNKKPGVFEELLSRLDGDVAIFEHRYEARAANAADFARASFVVLRDEQNGTLCHRS